MFPQIHRAQVILLNISERPRYLSEITVYNGTNFSVGNKTVQEYCGAILVNESGAECSSTKTPADAIPGFFSPEYMIALFFIMVFVSSILSLITQVWARRRRLRLKKQSNLYDIKSSFQVDTLLPQIIKCRSCFLSGRARRIVLLENTREKNLRGEMDRTIPCPEHFGWKEDNKRRETSASAVERVKSPTIHYKSVIAGSQIFSGLNLHHLDPKQPHETLRDFIHRLVQEYSQLKSLERVVNEYVSMSERASHSDEEFTAEEYQQFVENVNLLVGFLKNMD